MAYYLISRFIMVFALMSLLTYLEEELELEAGLNLVSVLVLFILLPYTGDMVLGAMYLGILFYPAYLIGTWAYGKYFSVDKEKESE